MWSPTWDTPDHPASQTNQRKAEIHHMTTAEKPIKNPAPDLNQLPTMIREQGLLDRQPRYYTHKMLSTTAMLAASIAILLLVENVWLQLLNAALLAFVFGQIGYLGHDAGHLAICRSHRGNRLIGYVSSTLMGVSSSWWMTTHNQHHRTPNSLEQDPHTMIPILAYSEERASQMRGILRVITGYQAFYFVPILTLEGLSMKYSSLKFLLFQERLSGTVLETILLAGHIVIYSTLLLHALGPWQALIFAAVNQALFGVYYGLVFAPNHKGMLILEKDNKLDFIRTQVLTTRNVRSHWLTDFIYGGLNYQIEHHLFTNMPRNQFAKAKPIIQEFCQQHGIPYHETSLVRSYLEIFSSLHQVAGALRRRTPTQAA